MGRKKKVAEKQDDPSANWIISETTQIHNRNVEKGTELSIQGERGRFHFLRYVYNPNIDVEWIDVVGGKKGVREFRSFRPQRVKRVHWKRKMRPTKEMIKESKM